MPVADPDNTTQGAGFSRYMAAVPGGFAFVMATGIVSIAAGAQGLGPMARILFAINLISLLALAVLSVFRLWRDLADLVRELTQHRTAPGFFTIVAAVAVLGDQFALQSAHREIAAALWLISSGLWVILIYAVFILLAISPRKPSLRGAFDGTWLLIVVATEALAVLGAHVAATFVRSDIILYLSLCWFLLGNFFYLIVIMLIMYRWLFLPLPPKELTPPYCINMGAMAITTLAGASLESVAGAHTLLSRLLPALAALTVLSWTIATWWIALLFGLMIWRHAARRVPIAYRPECWSMVFPLGMYTVATSAFAHGDALDFIDWIPQVFVWVALAAWLAAFVGAIRRGLGLALIRR
jgi:tellurite resistance protein TehA-like permease